VNLRAAISDIEVSNTKWTASVFVRNLTNENRLSNFIDFGPGFGGLTVGYYPDPRTWGLTLGTEF
jgi:iron complex outermembrane receptor protein